MSESVPLSPDGVLEAALYTPDLPAAEEFYRNVLGLRLIARQNERHVFFRCGPAVLLLFNPEATRNQTVVIEGNAIPKHGTRGAGHVAFAVDASALPAWRARLQRLGVAIESEITWPQGGHSI